YKQDENSPNALVSYYTKGSLVAAGLDMLIRHQTRGAKSLDDVMRLLWRRYGRRFYQGGSKGVPEDAMAELVREATGVDASSFIERCAYGREDVPLESLFAGQGIALSWKAPPAAPSPAIRARRMHADVQIAAVYEHGAAHQGGLWAGDPLVAVDGLRVTRDGGLERLLSAYQ